MKRRAGYVDEPASLMEQRKRLKPVAAADEPKTGQEAEEAEEFVDTDPKNKGNRKVRYEEPLSREDRQQDMYYLLAEALAELLSGKKAEMFRRRLEKGWTWAKEGKTGKGK